MTGIRIISFICILCTLFILSQTGELRYNGSIFPRLTALSLFVLSVILLVLSFIKKHKGEYINEQYRGNLRYIIGVFSIVVIWVCLLNVLGFVVSSVISLTVMTILLDLQRLTFNRVVFTFAIYTVLVIVLWLIFHRFLMVPLPEGLIL